uniref:Ig-like domain-containing protein n=1 Tax=Neogobius melanostomus TaxID=47308 RepID=A0A8C6T672_9GOBI
MFTTGLSHGARVLPDHLTATAGEKVILPASPFLVITWNFVNTSGINNNIIVSSSANNNTNAAYADRITLFKSTGSLELRDLTVRDNGEYSYLAQIYRYGMFCLFVFLVDGPENRHFTTSPSQEYIAQGSDLDLSCVADSKPSAEISWFVNGNLQSYTGPQYTLQNIQMSDSGSYSCQAFNGKTLRSATSGWNFYIQYIIFIDAISHSVKFNCANVLLCFWVLCLIRGSMAALRSQSVTESSSVKETPL